MLSAIALWRDDWAPNQWQTVLMFWCAWLSVQPYRAVWLLPAAG